MTEPSTQRLQAVLRSLGPGDTGPSAPAALYEHERQHERQQTQPLPDFAGRALARARQRTRRRGALTVAGAAIAVALAIGVVMLPAASRPDPAPPAGTTGPFAMPRVNVLLLGTDAGPGRTGVRPDTIVVASIDTRTGNSVLLGLPRNLQRLPFPPGSPGAAAWPDGFFCDQDACLLNSVWAWAEGAGKSYYPADPQAGLTATTQAAEGITGLDITETVTVSMSGLRKLIDAVGGVDLTVTERLPIGGNSQNPDAASWIEPGQQHLDGYHALWYTRSRWSTSDYDRMGRQRCLLKALLTQVDAPTLVARFPQIAKSLAGGLRTSIPLSELPAWAELVTKMRSGRLVTLGLESTDRANPDFPAIRTMVAQALTENRADVIPEPDQTTPRNAAAPATDEC